MENGSRTHEPTLRELTAEMDAVRELCRVEVRHLRDLVDERDRRYQERDDARRVAVDAALSAAKEQTASSFVASEKAIVKAETAQSEYNIRSNEFRNALDDQAKRLASRTELDAIKSALEEKIARNDSDIQDLRESRREGEGRGFGSKAMWGYVVGAVSFILLLLTIVVTVYNQVRVQ